MKTTPAFSEPDDQAELEDLLGKTHHSVFAQSATGAAFLQRILEARRLISQLALPAGPAYLALAQRDGLAAAPNDWRVIGRGLTVGRAPASDWVIADPRRRLSAAHFRIEQRGADYFVTDLKSTNGTWLNEGERPIASCGLRHGDFILAGGCAFLVILGYVKLRRAYSLRF
jgi:hypothetical protein